MSIAQQFESLHPDIIQSFIKTGKSEAIPEDIQRFILILDKIPDLHRRYPNISKCARVLISRYPEYNLAFHTAREFIYTAINYFHLNSTVKNEAWNQYYADRAEDLHHICVKMGDMKTAKEYLSLAHEWRLSKNENEIDVSKLTQVVHVISTEVTHEMLGIEKYNKKTLWSERRNKYDEAVDLINKMEINSEEKASLTEEVRLTYNISEAELCDGEPNI